MMAPVSYLRPRGPRTQRPRALQQGDTGCQGCTARDSPSAQPALGHELGWSQHTGDPSSSQAELSTAEVTWAKGREGEQEAPGSASAFATGAGQFLSKTPTPWAGKRVANPAQSTLRGEARRGQGSCHPARTRWDGGEKRARDPVGTCGPARPCARPPWHLCAAPPAASPTPHHAAAALAAAGPGCPYPAGAEEGAGSRGAASRGASSHRRDRCGRAGAAPGDLSRSPARPCPPAPEPMPGKVGGTPGSRPA